LWREEFLYRSCVELYAGFSEYKVHNIGGPPKPSTPTGVPATKTGQVALQFDTTNNKLYVYDGGWLATAALS